MAADKGSPALTLLRAAYDACGRVSDREMGYGMGYALKACFHLGLRFDAADVRVFNDDLGGMQAFGADGGERYYAEAVDCGNENACRSFEAFFGRPPFIYDGKRLRVASLIRWQERWYSITSFGTHKGEPVVLGCSYNYTSSVVRGKRHCEKKIDSRIRLTLTEVQEAERHRIAGVRRDRLVKEVGRTLDQWIGTNWMYPEMHHFIGDFTTEQLQEAKMWCEANQEAPYRTGGTSKALAAAPKFIANAFAAYHAGKARRRAKEEIETVLRRNVGAKDWEKIAVADTEIDARLRGDSIADILARGTLVPCEECKGNGRVDCGVCGSKYVKCGVCDGAGRVPAPMGRPDAADFSALCRTLDVNVEGGEVVGGAPLTFAPPPAPEPSRGAAALRAKASKSVVDEARAIQSPATKKALRDAGVLR